MLCRALLCVGRTRQRCYIVCSVQRTSRHATHPGSDFVNASYLTELDGRPTIIAAQGPLPGTVQDFWRMLWSHETKVIVMAAKCVENGKPKVERYWPQPGGSARYGEIHVTHVREDTSNKPDFIITTLRAQAFGITREIFHFQYVTWPDHGVPSSPKSVMKMLGLVRQKHDWKDQWPIVIHCSAGCGRTGTLAAIDSIWYDLKNELIDTEINVFQVRQTARAGRTEPARPAYELPPGFAARHERGLMKQSRQVVSPSALCSQSTSPPASDAIASADSPTSR